MSGDPSGAIVFGLLCVGVVAVRWTRADARVTARAVHLLQSTRMFGVRIGRPILAFPLRGAVLEPAVAASVTMGWLSTYPQEADRATA